MKKALIAIVVILVAICGVGTVAFQRMQAAQAAKAKTDTGLTVEKGDLEITVVDTGTVDAVKSVEVKSRVAGRLAQLLVDEGKEVKQGELVAMIDPKETQLQIDQGQAQLDGAEASAARTSIEIEQRKISAKASLDQAKLRVQQLKLESDNQPALTKAGIDSAQTSLNSNRAERERLVQTVHPNARVAAQTTVDEAQANYDNSLSNYNRQKALLDKGYTAAQNVETAKLNLDVARARLTSSKDSLSRLTVQQSIELQKVDENIRQAQAELKRVQTGAFQDQVKRQELATSISQVEAAQAALKDVQALEKSKLQSLATVRQLSANLGESKRQFGETNIVSPMTGVVTRRYMEVGELVAPLSGFNAGSPIIRVEDRTALRVKLSINEIDVAKLKVGMIAEVAVDALPDVKFEGYVYKIAPSSQNLTSGTTGQATGADAVVKYDVEVRLKSVNPELKSGMSAKCTMIVWRLKDVLKVPVEYVGKDDKGSFVMLDQGKGKKATRQEVKAGQKTAAMVQILSGVTAGQKLAKPEFTGPPRQGMMGMGAD